MELSFSRFNYKENLRQQRALFQDCFPETHGEVIQKEIYYKWKFHSFPSTIRSWEYACHSDHEMVGYYAALPYRYKIGNKTTQVGMVCDVMTSSKQRGKGIFAKMGTYSTNNLSSEVSFTMGYPIRKEVIPGHLKVGWKIPFSLPLYIKFIHLNSLLRRKKMGFLAPIANICLEVYNRLVKTRFNHNYSYSITSDIANLENYNEFVTEWSVSLPNALLKDSKFAQWRYGAPERKYKFLSLTDTEGKMIAFVSFRKIIKEDIPTYGIIDYMVLPGHEDCHGLINKVLIDSAKKEQVEAIITMMSKNSATEYKLYKNGYLKSPFVFKLIIKNLTKEFNDEELFNEKNWHLMWIDSDDL